MKKKSLVNGFLDVFTTNKYVYETSQSIEMLRGNIQWVINQKEIFDFKYNLSGNLNPDNSFKLARRAGLMLIQSWDRDPVSIKGKLIENQAGPTKVEIDVKPNFIFILFPVLFGASGIGALVYSIFIQDKQTIMGGLFFLVFVLIMWGMAKYSKEYYKSEFERALELPKNDVILKRTIKF